MSRMRIAIRLVAALCLIAMVGLVVATGVHYVRRQGADLAALRNDNAALATVAKALPLLEAEVDALLAEKHVNPGELRKLRKQIQTLRSTLAAPRPAPTATVTRTAPPKPRATVTVRPRCRGVAIDHGGCIPTKFPTPLPSAHL